MNEEHKKRGIMHSKFFTAVAISALLLGSSNVMATQTAESSIYGVAEQLQTITVTGVVLDATGEPIIGASVVEKGTTNGGITDINGKFTLSVKQGAVLKISYVGYQTQEVKAVRTLGSSSCRLRFSKKSQPNRCHCNSRCQQDSGRTPNSRYRPRFTRYNAGIICCYPKW